MTSPVTHVPGEVVQPGATKAPKTPRQTGKQDIKEAIAIEKHDPGALPDAADIDPTTLKRAVLTKQGWVCPPSTPHPAQRP